MLRTLLALSVCASILGCSSSQEKVASIFDREPDMIGTTMKIAGYNSFLVNDTYVTLYGVSPIYFSQRCLDAESKIYSCGLKHFEYLQGVLRKAKSVRCYFANDYQPTYIGNGTQLPMHCFVNGLNLNELLVANGYALTFDPLYIPSQSMARKMKYGVWDGKFMHPEQYDRYSRDGVDANMELYKGNMVFKEQLQNDVCEVKAINRSGDKVYFTSDDPLYKQVKVNNSVGDSMLCSEHEALSLGYRRVR